MKTIIRVITLVLGMTFIPAIPANAVATGTDAECAAFGPFPGETESMVERVCVYESWARKASGHGNWSQGTKVGVYNNGELHSDCPIYIDYLIIEKASGVNVGERHGVCLPRAEAKETSAFVWPHNPDLNMGRRSYYHVKARLKFRVAGGEDQWHNISFNTGYGVN